MMNNRPTTVGTYTLEYGQESRLSLSLPRESLVAHCGKPQGNMLADPVAAVREVLADPLEFPPLVKATVPGDRVAIAVDRGVPQAAGVVAGIVETLVDGYVSASDIRIVLAPGFRDLNRLTSQLSAQHREQVAVEVHEPANPDKLAYLAAAQNAKPIYINRSICDADVVIPVGCVKPDAAIGYVAGAAGVFPSFADAETWERYHAPSSWLLAEQRKQRLAEAREAAWLLGIQFTVQVVPAAGEALLHVLAGELGAVSQQGRRLTEVAWNVEVPRRASLVVAAIEGGPEQQTWDSFAHALFATLRLVEDGGAIVICSELNSQPGPALQRIMNDEVGENSPQDLLNVHSDDAVSASQLAEAIRRVQVYLLSDLDDETVEQWGVAPVGHSKDVSNLCVRFPSCILLANAQQTVPVVAAEAQRESTE